jgi:tetratricopeptide (TPR) repeat protein
VPPKRLRSRRLDAPNATAPGGEGLIAPAHPIAARRASWALLIVACLAMLLWHARATPLGEPFADDFLFLERVRLGGPYTWLDGGGSPLYWRPLGRQAYFQLFGALLLAQPLAMALLHAALLGAAAWLVYRALRATGLAGAPAAVAASFPLLVESARMLIGWPSHFQDVGALFFASLALHEAARGRLGTLLPAALASLLCKEVGALTLFLLPWWPGARVTLRWRWRASVALAAVVGAWAAVYAWVTARAGVTFAHEYGAQAEPATASPLVERVLWALTRTARSLVNLPERPGPLDLPVALALAGIAIGAGILYVRSRDARDRFAQTRALAAWGLAWFLLAAAPLAEVHPSWSAQRVVYAGAGAGVACAALLVPAHVALLVPLVVLRFATFALSPAGSRAVPAAPPEAGHEFDYRHFARLQWTARHTRDVLRAHVPHPSPHTVVGQYQFPLLARHTLAGDASLRSWYADSTLSWVTFEQYRTGPRDVAGFVAFQPGPARQFVWIDGPAMAALVLGSERVREAHWRDALAAFERAESQQKDTSAVLFLGAVAAKQAVCLSALGEPERAEARARRALEWWPDNPDSRYTLAERRLAERRYASAETLLIEQLRRYPNDTGAATLLERARAEALGRTP